MADVPGHLRDSLPPDLSCEEIEDCVHLSRSLSSLLGDTLLLKTAGEWRVYSRTSMVDPFARVALRPGGLAFCDDGLFAVIELTTEDGAVHSLNLPADSGGAWAARFPRAGAPAGAPRARPAPSAAPARAASEPAYMAEVRALVAKRQHIQAIKVLREATCLGLREAKEAVDALASGRVPAQSFVSTPTPPADWRGDRLAGQSEIRSGNWLDEVHDLLKRGQKIAAIQRYRTATGASLKEAKDAVDAMERG